MADPYRLATTPSPVLGPLRVATLAGVLSIDALRRWARARGRDAEWAAAALGGDLAGQRAVERQLVRRGMDRGSVGRAGFAEEARSFGAETEDQARRQLETLGIAMPDRAGRTGDEASALAARTAFVRLYERGLLRLVESVAPECPSCRTVLDELDHEPVELDDHQLVVRLPYEDGDGAL